MNMTIFDKVIQIYQKYYICTHCLGRMFSLLGTNTTNHERGKSLLLSLTMENHRRYLSRNQDQNSTINNLEILAENAHFIPAKRVIEKEGLKFKENNSSRACFLCQNVFENTQKYANKAEKRLKKYEFDNFIIGTRVSSEIINNEDKFKAEFNLLESESFKSHFNREVGKELTKFLNKPPEFGNPDITIIFNLKHDDCEIDLILRSLFIYGKYTKLIRGIPQTHWDCKKCMGKGCPACNYTGKQYATSIEELINSEFIKESVAEDSKFHGAGREDIDVKMLGEGRPFVLELINPVKRSLDLKKIQKKVNRLNRKKVKISELKFSNKNQVKKMKSEAENTKKTYRALVFSEIKILRSEFEEINNKLKSLLENTKIQQRTPLRVVHRRADKVREKKIYKINGKILKPYLFEFIIETQGGTYIKELINGDSGRTNPSFTEIFGFPLICKKLDVIKIN